MLQKVKRGETNIRGIPFIIRFLFVILHQQNHGKMKLFHLLFTIFTIAIFASCDNNRLLKVIDDIKAQGDTNPVLAIEMLDSIKPDIEREDVYVRMKYMLLKLRLNDKAYLLPQNDDAARIVVSYFEQSGSAVEKQEAYYYAGSVYRDLQDAPRALEYFMKSEDVAQDANVTCDSIILRNAYSNMAVLFFNVQDYHSSLEMAKKEYDTSCKMGKITKHSLSHITDCYLHLDSIHQADSISRIMEQYIDWKNAQDVYGLLHLYSYTKNRQKADSIYHIINQPSLEADATGYNALADYHLLQGNTDSAIACYEKILGGGHDVTYTYDAARFLFGLYKMKGNNKASIRCSDIFMKCSDSLDFGKRQELLATVKNQYLYYKDRAREESMRKDNEKYHNRLVILTIATLLLTTTFIAFYYYKKNRYLSSISNVSNKLNVAREEKSRLENEAMRIEQTLKSTRVSLDNKEEELENVKRDLHEIEIELKYKEELLVEKLEVNKTLINMLHKAELEEKSEEIISSIRESSKGKYSISTTEWQKIYHAIDRQQPALMDKIIQNLGQFTEQQKQVCYLMSIGLTNVQIENITHLPHATVWRWTKKFGWINS